MLKSRDHFCSTSFVPSASNIYSPYNRSALTKKRRFPFDLFPSLTHIMSSPTTMDEISQVERSLTELSKQALQNEDSRKKLLEILKAQVAALESPLEVIWRMMMEPHQSAPLRTALAMGLIEALASSESPKTAAELATISNCDKQLIGTYPP